MKKNYFLRILSIAFVICMAVALLPTVFASDTEYAMSGITVVYPFEKGVYSAAGATKGKDISYANSSGRVAYDSFYSPSGGAEANPSFGWYTNPMNLDLRAGEHYAFKIRIPKKWYYGVTVAYSERNIGTEGAMYILPGDTENIATTIASMDPLVTFDSYGATDITYKDTYITTNEVMFNAEEAGEYYIVWCGTGDKFNTNNRYTLLPRFVTLNGGDEAPVVMYAESELSKNTIDSIIGETATISTTTAKMSDGTDATATDIDDLKYISSDVEIATVSGNTITAVSKGNVKIYTMSGDLKVAENDLTVKTEYPMSGVTVVYPFEKGVYSVAGATKGKDISYANSSGRVAYDSFYSPSGRAEANPSFGWYTNPMNLDLRAGEHYAFKIRIPKKGYYGVTVAYSERNIGTEGAMYILPGDTENIATTIASMDPLVTFDSYGETDMTWKDTYMTTDEVMFNAEEAGEYYIVWCGTGDKFNTNNRYNLLPRFVTLNGGDSAALMGTKISSDKRVIALAGEETAQVTAIGYLSTTGEAVGFTYSSENPSVATVSADGTVTAKNGGVAKITATCTNAVSGNNSLSTMIVVDEPS
ncbi:MAG: Ig-like domain-containing protein, partial [Oscillospiraceae bacterium]|nr:Ig-like domain-containing protein [Oscillospiraceae bacterium]